MPLTRSMTAARAGRLVAVALVPIALGSPQVAPPSTASSAPARGRRSPTRSSWAG
jgi:hypothetical protein